MNGRSSRYRWVWIAPLVLLLITSCAKIGTPPGGPEDKTGPALISHYPELDAVNVSRRMAARLEFSEPVNRTTVETSLFLSPDPRQRLRYHWSGRTLELIYLDSLEEDRTYVISVGSQARDLRGNPSGTTYTIAFSTGPQIDRGHIRGWLGDVETPQAIYLWAYHISADSACDPLRAAADYIVQADENGRFDLNYLKSGRYRVFAIQDRNRDGLWTPPGEIIGIPPWDVDVLDTTAAWLSFKLSQQDTTSARIRTTRSVNSFQMDLRLNRDVVSLTGEYISESGDTLAMLNAYPDTAGLDQWITFAPRALTEGNWLVRASGVDIFENPWYDLDTCEVKARADTARPRLFSMNPANNSKSRIVPDRVELTFNEPISVDTAWTVVFHLLASDTDTVACDAAIAQSRILEIRPAISFEQARSYRLQVNGQYIHDMSGNAYHDSTVTFRFTIWPDDSLGILVGRITGVEADNFILDISGLRRGETVATTTVSGNGEFRVERLPATHYTLQAVRDDDGDGKYSYGLMRPFRFSEPFWLSPDTIMIRARWEYETTIQWPNNP
ncbi:MAG: Ig-like domain-containing protein [Calditrichota bacterium]